MVTMITKQEAEDKETIGIVTRKYHHYPTLSGCTESRKTTTGWHATRGSIGEHTEENPKKRRQIRNEQRA